MSEIESHDLLVIGGGPAGISAAMSAEDNGYDTLVLDDSVLGGQAATATLIENYPGFPKGISGPELVKNIVSQALRYTTEFEAPARVVDIQSSVEGIIATTDDGVRYMGRTALLSIGLEPRKLRARNLAAYRQRGAKYGTPERGEVEPGESICIVGGSDAAAQTAVHMAEQGHEVNLILRGENLQKKARQSLIDKIAANELIRIHPNSEVIGVDGDGCLEEILLRDKAGEIHTLSTRHLFILIGAEPKTLWLPGSIAKDRRGFVPTGSLLDEEQRHAFLETTGGRPPYNHETSVPGLFAAGDIRSGTRKMVTMAIFDGASVIPELQELEIYNKLHKRHTPRPSVISPTTPPSDA